jgi:hypothetical protein
MAETVIRTGQATETALGPLHSVPDNMEVVPVSVELEVAVPA